VYDDHPVAATISSTVIPLVAHCANTRTRSPGSGCRRVFTFASLVSFSLVVVFIATTVPRLANPDYHVAEQTLTVMLSMSEHSA
jgi:hypothetical protein